MIRLDWALRSVPLVAVLLLPIPVLAEPGDALLWRTMTQPVALAAQVDDAIGGATAPKARAEVFIKALTRFAKEQKRFQKRARTILETNREIMTSLGKKGLKKRSLARGFKAYRLLLPELKAAHLSLYGAGRLMAPLDGGNEVGTELFGLGLVIGAKGVDFLSRRKYKKAVALFTAQVRLGALLVGAPHSYQDMAGGISLIQTGLGLLAVTHFRRGGDTGIKAYRRFKAISNTVGTIAAKYRVLREALRDPAKIGFWQKVAMTHPNPVWQYEAIHTLSRFSRKTVPDTRRSAARAALRNVASAPSRVGRAASRLLEKIQGK
jgi:hypothetical protein